MATWTLKGSASSKSSGTTLLIPKEELGAFRESSMIVVGMDYDGSADPTSVQWVDGAKAQELRERLPQYNANADFTTSAWTKRFVHNEDERDILITWPGAIVAKNAIVIEVMDANGIDRKTGRSELTTTTNPGTGQTPLLEFPDDLAIAFFGSAGPVGDAPGTAQIEDNDVLQPAAVIERIGTTGAGAASNLTLQATALSLTSTATTRGVLQAATQRRWASVLLALGARAWLNTVTGTFTAEVFTGGETSAEAAADALATDIDGVKTLEFTSISVSSVDSTTEQVFGTDWVK